MQSLYSHSSDLIGKKMVSYAFVKTKKKNFPLFLSREVRVRLCLSANFPQSLLTGLTSVS